MITVILIAACTVLFLVLAYRERAKYLAQDADDLIGGEELDRLGELLGVARMYCERDARYRMRLRRAVGSHMQRVDRAS